MMEKRKIGESVRKVALIFQRFWFSFFAAGGEV